MSLFKRAWEILIDDLDISNLECQFHVERNTKPVPNKCELRINNLSPDHVAQITKRAKLKATTGVRVQISAGYVGNVPVIFSGDARETSTTHDGADRVTTISAHDGGRAYRESRVNVSLAPGASISGALIACAQAMGIGIGNAVQAAAGASIQSLGQAFPNGTVLSGPASKELDRIVRACGMTWSIQNGVLQILVGDQALTTEAIRLSVETGLVGSPAVDMDASIAAPSATGKVAKKPTLVSARTLMIPGLGPGRRVFLDSEGFTGTYQITQADYLGAVDSQDWNCQLKLRPVA